MRECVAETPASSLLQSVAIQEHIMLSSVSTARNHALDMATNRNSSFFFLSYGSTVYFYLFIFTCRSVEPVAGRKRSCGSV